MSLLMIKSNLDYVFWIGVGIVVLSIYIFIGSYWRASSWSADGARSRKISTFVFGVGLGVLGSYYLVHMMASGETESGYRGPYGGDYHLDSLIKENKLLEGRISQLENTINEKDNMIKKNKFSSKHSDDSGSIDLLI